MSEDELPAEEVSVEDPGVQDGVRLIEPKPNLMDFITRQRRRNDQPENGRQDPDRFLRAARQLVVDNYNANRNPKRTQELTIDKVYVDSFMKTLANWKAIVGCTVLKGLLWEVSYNGQKKTAYISVYKKINDSIVNTETRSD